MGIATSGLKQRFEMRGDKQMQSRSIVLTEEEEDALSSVFEEELQLQRDEETHLRLANPFVSCCLKSSVFLGDCEMR